MGEVTEIHYVQMYYLCMYGTRTPYALWPMPYPYVQIPLLVVLVQNIVHNIQTLSVNQLEGNAGKMENTKQKFHVMWFLLEYQYAN